MFNPTATSARYLFACAWLFVACDAGRKSDYRGDFPPPQTLDFGTITTSSDTAGLVLYTWTHQSPGYWQSRREGTADNPDGPPLRFTGPTRMTSALWAGVAAAMSGFQDPRPPLPIEVTPTVAFATVGLEFWQLAPGPYGSTVDVGGGPDLVAAGINHLLVASDREATVQPVGPSGPTVPVAPGFQMFHRSCTADAANVFEPEPLDTTIEMSPVPATLARLGSEQAYLASCGLTLTSLDLGQPTTMPGTDPDTADRLSWSLAWGPNADIVYYVADNVDHTWASIGRFTPALGTFSTLATGHYEGPVQVAANGTALIFNELIDQNDYHQSPVRVAFRLSLQPGSGPVAGQLTPHAYVTTPAVLSPDGTMLATRMNDAVGTTTLIDMATGAERPLASGGEPAAFAPDGKALFTLGGWVNSPTPWRVPAAGQLVPTDGSLVPTTVEGLQSGLSWTVDDPCSAWASNGSRMSTYRWSSSGLWILVQDCQGTRAQNLVTAQVVQIVEANRRVEAQTQLEMVVATDQLFAWARQCFGLGETACNLELRRVSLTTGKRDVVATANEILPFAVSLDGQKLAIAKGASVYLKALAP
jgi:hypothetical protein